MGILSLYFDIDHKKDDYAVAAAPRQVTRDRMIRRLGWKCEPSMKAWLRREIAALTPVPAKAKAKAKAKKRTGSARRAGRSARAPAAGDDGDGDGDSDPERPRRFYIPSSPCAPTRDQLAPWESLLRAEGFTSETCAPWLTYAPDHYADHYADAGINRDDSDLDADDGDELWRDPTNPFRTRIASVVADLIADEDAAAITPAIQARLDRAAKAKAEADADRLKRQRLAVLEACDNPRQRLVFEILCGGATAEEAARAAGYASASVVTKMIERWKVRAGKGRIAIGFEQLDLFGGAV